MGFTVNCWTLATMVVGTLDHDASRSAPPSKNTLKNWAGTITKPLTPGTHLIKIDPSDVSASLRERAEQPSDSTRLDFWQHFTYRLFTNAKYTFRLLAHEGPSSLQLRVGCQMNPDVWACVHCFLTPCEQAILRRVGREQRDGFTVYVSMGWVPLLYGAPCCAGGDETQAAPFPMTLVGCCPHGVPGTPLVMTICDRLLVAQLPRFFHSLVVALDLSRCSDLEAIKDDFLCANLLHVKLPTSLKAIGSGLLAGSAVKSIDFSMCCNLEAVGHKCLSGSAVRAIDLSSCSKLQSLDDYFLSDTKKLRSVILPLSLKRIGNDFLMNSDIETINLSMCCNRWQLLP
jgi:hypothetical protein